MNLQCQLYRYFGYTYFRPQQEQIVTSILEHTDTLALLPTGAGKSICFQLPALLLPGVTLVVSPLIALMQDQVENLVKKNIFATYLSSTLSEDEVQARIELISREKFKIIYVAPERLKNKKFTQVISKLTLSLVVIDEAHCISQWGYDFRPDYLEIKNWINALPSRPIIAAFTATATEQTMREIVRHLDLQQPEIVRQSFERKNLHIRVIETPSYQLQEVFALSLIQKHKSTSTIIYVATHQAAERLTAYLHQFEVQPAETISFYHAGLTAQERNYRQKLFIGGKIKIMIATSAFGMGIDKGDIGCIIHYQFSGSIEAYYQEIGRGGRNGENCYCYLLYNSQNRSIHLCLSQQGNSESEYSALVQLQAIQTYCESSKCRMVWLLSYFNERKQESCGRCDNCLQSYKQKNKLRFVCTKNVQEKISKLVLYRSKIQKLSGAEHPAWVLTDGQLLQVALTSPRSIEDYKKLTGFGEGWQKHWLSHFLDIDDKIQTITTTPKVL